MFSLKDAQTWPRGEQHELEAALISQRGNWKAKGVERKHTDNEQESYGTILRRWVAVLPLPWAMTLVCLLWTAVSLSPERVHITFHWALGIFKVGESSKKQEVWGQLVVPSLAHREGP